MQPITPYSSHSRLTKLDGRRREARAMDATRARLTAHVGGSPSATELVLIQRAARLALQIDLLDAKSDAHGLTEHDSKAYLAWVGTLARVLRQLGLKGATARPTTLADHIAGKTAAR